jgi:hypothetical protein
MGKDFLPRLVRPRSCQQRTASILPRLGHAPAG